MPPPSKTNSRPPRPEPESSSGSPHRLKHTRQTWQRQAITLIPLIAIVVFLGITLLSLWYLHTRENQYRQGLARQSVEKLQQQIHLLVANNENAVRFLATDLSQVTDIQSRLNDIGPTFIENHPEIAAIYWYDGTDGRIYNYRTTGELFPPEEVNTIYLQNLNVYEPQNTSYNHLYIPGLASYGIVYGPPYVTEKGGAFINFSIVLFNQQQTLQNTLTVTYSLERILHRFMPPAASLYLAVWLQDQQGQILASTAPAENIRTNTKNSLAHYDMAIGDFRHPISIYAQNIDETKSLASNFLFWFSVCLCIFIVLLLLLNWQQLTLQLKAQKRTQKESNFRRAIENSTTTGLLTRDSDGCIIYANPAFCQMTGFEQEELMGCRAPYPYWPQDKVEELAQNIHKKIVQTSPTVGREVQLQRKNGELFYARLYVSPLIDESNQHTGWVTAMTDESESKRNQEELALAGQRFTTVLEGMDSAISVVAVGATELLFANHSYRRLFGGNAQGHITLAKQTISAAFSPSIHSPSSANPEGLRHHGHEHYEIYIEEQKRWVEVRSRYLPWVDGRLAQMLITTDITEQHRAREQAAIQAEQTREAGRLMTMGEMASSVAHELNQPLTAISNYCLGLIRRIQSHTLTETDLLAALEKTAKQAARAGKIIQRIRDFVKKSTPNRVLTPVAEIIENVQELAEIDARRRDVELNIHLEKNLPPLLVDPILIEQVLLNLVRNAVDSIETAQRPLGMRHIDVDIRKSVGEDNIQQVEFCVQDTGTGLPSDIIGRMFEAFFTTKKNGLGIGLNLCRSIIESHGGHLYFKNTYNNDILTGCQVAFALPLIP